MAKTLEVLKNLQEQQKQERERIEQLHKQNLQTLNEGLMRLYQDKLTTIEDDIKQYLKRSLKKELREIDETMWQYQQIIKWLLIALVIVLLLGGIAGYWLNKVMTEKNNYILNKQEWLHKQNDEIEWFIRRQSAIEGG